MKLPVEKPDPGYPSDYQWENLANAVCTQAIRDYERCISDQPLPDAIQSSFCNLGEIKLFFRNQTLTQLPLGKVAKRIDRIYNEEFRPYVKENYRDICESWIHQTLDHKDKEYQKRHHPFVCPSCGGLLRPEKKMKWTPIAHIVCTDCNLNMRIPDEAFINKLNQKKAKKISAHSVRCVETGIVYSSGTDAARTMFGDEKVKDRGYRIKTACKNGKMILGYHWEEIK